MAHSTSQADRIRRDDTSLDYEREAIESVARSWELTDPVCQRLALADALVWATLHHARVTERSGARAAADREAAL